MVNKIKGVRYAFFAVLLTSLISTLYFTTQNHAESTLTAPQQVHISWVNDTKTTMTVMWQTDQPTKTSTVQYGETKTLGKEVTGTTETYDAATGIIHKVEMTKLKPGTTYYYKVGNKEDGWSNTFAFKTAPAKTENFSFVAVGDVGVTEHAAKNVSLIAELKPAFTLILGDLSYANGKHGMWDLWINEIQPAAANIPFMMTLGNHEFEKVKKARRGVDAYIVRFSHPGNEFYYSFDYAGSHFIAVNCLNITDMNQQKWLEADLQKAAKSKANWTFVYLHYPPYSSSASHGSDLNVRKILNPFFEKYGVDVVFTGHDHQYERTFPIKAEKTTSNEKAKYKKGAGTIYVVSGGGGKSLYKFLPDVPEWSAVRESTYEILILNVSQAKLSAKAMRTKDKSVLDAFEVIK